MGILKQNKKNDVCKGPVYLLKPKESAPYLDLNEDG